MTQELRNYIKSTEFLAVQEASAAVNGTIIDTYIDNTAGHHQDMAMVIAGAGEFGTDIDHLNIKVLESDSAVFASSSVARGGEEVEVGEGEQNVFQIERSKRYLRITVTPVEITSPSETPGEDSFLVYATGLLTNWAVPLPLL